MEQMVPTEVAVALQCVAIVLPLVGNVSMIVIVCRVPMLHTPSFVLLSCLAAVDIILALVWNFPFDLIDKTQTIHIAGSEACTVLGIVWQTAVSMSALLQAIVTCDRYLFIVHPFKYQRSIKCGRAAFICVVVFALSVSLPAFTFVSGEPYQMEKPTMTCIQSKLWPLMFLIIIFMPSLALAAFCSLRVWVLYSKMLQQIELMQDCILTPIFSLGSHLDLKHNERKTLRKVIQSVILCNRVLKKMGIKRQRRSKPDRNTAAPTVMVTSCDKNGDVSILSSRSCIHHSNFSGHSLTPVETPLSIASFGISAASDSVISPRSSCSSQGIISWSNCPTERSPNLLSPYPYQSRRTSVCSNDSSKSHILSISPEGSCAPVFDFQSTESAFTPSSFSPSSCSVSLYGTQSSQSTYTGSKDILAHGSSTVSAILSALIVKPDIFLGHRPKTQLGKSSFLSPGQRKKERKFAMAALYWASVGNPVISWMLSSQSDLHDSLKCENIKINKTGRVSPFSLPVSTQEPTTRAGRRASSVRTTHGEFWKKTKAKLVAKCYATKTLLLLWGPLYLLVISFLPYSLALIIWEFGLRTPLSFQYVYVVCFLTYTIVPSLAPLLLCLTNKPYRNVLFKYTCCCKKTNKL